MSSSDDFQHIPQSRDGAPNWAADTDPVGPVTPELALVDPGLASGGHNNEVTMSSTQFGDGTMFGAAEPVPAPLEHQQEPALQPVQPLMPPVEASEAVPVAPIEPAPVSAVPVGDMRDVPLGTLVFRAGLLPEEQLEEALQEGMKTGKRLGEILLERRWVSETDLGRLLAAQKGLSFVELDPSTVDPTAPPLLHPEKARLHGALPIGFEGGVPVVAVADPSNDLVVENVRRALACEPVLVVAGRDALMSAINQVYGADPTKQAAPEAAPVVEPVAAEPVVEEPAAVVEPLIEPVAPVVDPVAPVVEPVAAAPVVEEPAPVVEPFVEPVVEPVVEPAAVVEPVVPVLPVVAEEVTPPVAPPLTVEPVAVEPLQNGDGVWLGQPPEGVSAPPVVAPPPEPVAFVAAPEPFIEPEVAPVVPAPASLAVTEPDPEPVVEPVDVPEPLAEPDHKPLDRVQLTHTVVLRLADGERVETGSFPGETEAADAAREIVAQIAADGSWPFFGGRFIRPEGIVSIDLVKLEVTRWLGSSARAAALGPEHQPAS